MIHKNRMMSIVGLAALCLFSLYELSGHSPVYNPPPPPPDWAGITVAVPGRGTTSGRGNGLQPGVGTTGSTGISPPGPQAAGSLTKKSRGTTSAQATWEYWWARNRYRFLEFAVLNDRIRAQYPLSPEKDRGEGLRGPLQRFRKHCIECFQSLVDNPSARLRRASLIGLATIHAEDAMPLILKGLEDGNQTVRDSAVLALGLFDQASAKHSLLHMVTGTREIQGEMETTLVPDYLKGFAQVALAIDKFRNTGSVLKGVLEDKDASDPVKALALESLGILGGEEAAKVLVDFIEQKTQAPPEVLASAAAALGKTGAPFVTPFLEKLLFHDALYVRQSAALALGTVAAPGDERSVALLTRLFRHSNDQALKGFSLISMGRIGGEKAVAILDQTMMQGKSSECPWACIGLGLALRRQADEQAAGHLVQQARDHANRSTRGAAAIALGLARCREAAPTLITLVRQGDDPDYRGYCATALGMIHDETAVPALKEALAEDDLPQVKTQAALALAQVGDTDSVPDLLELLFRSDNDAIKSFVALSLCFMNDLRVVERLDASFKDKSLDDLTLAHCIYLAAKLVSGQTVPYLDPLAVNANFACEYSVVGYLLDYGI